MNPNNCYNCNHCVQEREADYCLATDLMIQNPGCCASHTALIPKTVEGAQQQEGAIQYNPPQVFAGDQYAFDPLQWS